MIKNSVYGIYFARCMNIFNSLLLQLVKYDVHTTRKINSIHAIFITYYHFSFKFQCSHYMERLLYIHAYKSENFGQFFAHKVGGGVDLSTGLKICNQLSPQ